MNIKTPLTAIDLYKTNHINFYPENLTVMYENFTPRSTKHLVKIEGTDDKVVLIAVKNRNGALEYASQRIKNYFK